MKTLDELPFVSFNTALLLEEAGYGEKSLVVYKYDTKTKDNAELICLGAPKKNIKLENYSTVAALTLDEAIEFIRYRYRTIIFLEPVFYSDNIVSFSDDGRPHTIEIFDSWKVYFKTEYSSSSLYTYIVSGKNKNETLEKGINLFLTKQILDKDYDIILNASAVSLLKTVTKSL